MRTERRAHWLAVAVLAIPALQVLLFLVSWLINAASPESVVRSLLGSEGTIIFVTIYMTTLTVRCLIEEVVVVVEPVVRILFIVIIYYIATVDRIHSIVYASTGKSDVAIIQNNIIK